VGVRTELGVELAGVRTELGAQLVGLGTELRAELVGLGTELVGVRTELRTCSEIIASRWLLVR
jgi:hypothetical protein